MAVLPRADFEPARFSQPHFAECRILGRALFGHPGLGASRGRAGGSRRHGVRRRAARLSPQRAARRRRRGLRRANANVSMSAISAALYPPAFDHAWRAVTCVENHDLVLAGRDPRLPALADPSNHRSWYARSRSRVATAILLTAPGIPQIFMGQEFLEDRPWDVDPRGPNLLSWDGLDSPQDSTMRDHLRFTRDLIRLRRDLPALHSDNVHAFYQSDSDRVIAYHRWREGIGDD